MTSISVKPLVLFMHCFPDFFELSICVLTAHWTSLKQLFWILCQAICRSPFVSGWLLGNHHVPLAVSCFLDFSVFLEVLHCCLRIWRSSHLLQSLLSDFGRELPSPGSLTRDFEAFSDFLFGCAFPTLLSSSWRVTVDLISIPQKSQVPRASHLFSLGWCPEMLKFVSLFPIQSHAGFLHLVTSYLQKLAFMVCRSKCQNQAKKVSGVVMGQMCGVLGMPMSHLDSCRQGVSSG